jgi:voltage-gated potassium channel
MAFKAKKRGFSENQRRLILVLAAFVAVIFIGVAGYMTIERYSFLDALYMTVITLSTVGYGVIRPLSQGGKIFTMFLIIGGVGFVFYGFTAFVQYFIENRLRDRLGSRRMKKDISQLKEHIILCGYGRVGREVARMLAEEGVPFVAIDGDQKTYEKAVEDGCLCIHGNASKDEILHEAGIQTAKALIAAVGNDADNIYITFSAKVLRPDILVVARGSDEESEAKLKRAGADRTLLPLNVSGRRMAMLAIHPVVADFIETTIHNKEGGLLLEDIKVEAGSSMIGKTLGEVQKQSKGMIILALRRGGGKFTASPAPGTIFEAGDEMITMASDRQLQSLEGSE